MLTRAFRPLSSSARGLATKVAVGGAGGALGTAVLARLAAGGLKIGDLELKVTGASPMPAASGSIVAISAAKSPADLVSDADYAIILSGEPAQFQDVGKALKAGAVVGVLGNTNALIVSSWATNSTAIVTSITKHVQASGEALLKSKVRRRHSHSTLYKANAAVPAHPPPQNAGRGRSDEKT